MQAARALTAPPVRVTMVLESGVNPRPVSVDPSCASYGTRPRSRRQRADRVQSIPSRIVTVSLAACPCSFLIKGNIVPNLALEMLRVGSGAGAVGIVSGQPKAYRAQGCPLVVCP